MKRQNIIIPTCNEFRIRTFDEYFNIFNEAHNIRFTFVCDDRGGISRKQYETVFASLKNKDLYDVYFATDVVKDLSSTFADCAYYDSILTEYPLSIKLLIFIWAKKFLGFDKSMLLDDDVLFLKPITQFYEENDYARKKDSLSKLCVKSRQALQLTYPDFDILQFEKARDKVNSGSIIYTWKDEHDLLGWVKKFFSSEPIDKLIRIKKYEWAAGLSRALWGSTWLLEQYSYGMFMHHMGMDKYAHFGNLVNTGISKASPKISPLQVIHNIVHFLPRDKMPLYEFYLARLNKTDLQALTNSI